MRLYRFAKAYLHITKGYTRDHRPDLNQIVLDLIVQGIRPNP